MRVNYKGMDPDYQYRVAEITFDEDSESVSIVRIADLMKIHGWDIEIVTNGYALCEVDDKEQYKDFMEDWKRCKRCILNCIKYGF